MGCCASDHALEYVMYACFRRGDRKHLRKNVSAGNDDPREEELKFKTAFMVNVGKEYTKRNCNAAALRPQA